MASLYEYRGIPNFSAGGSYFMRILNDLATFRLLGAIPLRSPFGARDHALIRFDMHVGLRVGELEGLNIDNVWGQNGPREWLDLPPQIAKGNKSRRIPLNAGAQRAIRELVQFLRMRGFKSEPTSPLFQDRHHRRLPAREIQRMIQKYREAADLDIKVTPHSLRHTWASNLARNNSIRAVQQLAGHDFLTSTEVYLHNQPADLVAAVQSLPDF